MGSSPIRRIKMRMTHNCSVSRKKNEMSQTVAQIFDLVLQMLLVTRRLFVKGADPKVQRLLGQLLLFLAKSVGLGF